MSSPTFRWLSIILYIIGWSYDIIQNDLLDLEKCRGTTNVNPLHAKFSEGP